MKQAMISLQRMAYFQQKKILKEKFVQGNA